MQSLRQPKVKALVALTLFFALAGIALAVYLAVRSDEPDDPFRGDAITDAPFASLTYGVHTFLWWDSNMAGLHMDWVDYSMYWVQYAGVFEIPKGIIGNNRIKSWDGRQQHYSNVTGYPEYIVLNR